MTQNVIDRSVTALLAHGWKLVARCNCGRTGVARRAIRGGGGVTARVSARWRGVGSSGPSRDSGAGIGILSHCA